MSDELNVPPTTVDATPADNSAPEPVETDNSQSAEPAKAEPAESTEPTTETKPEPNPVVKELGVTEEHIKKYYPEGMPDSLSDAEKRLIKSSYNSEKMAHEKAQRLAEKEAKEKEAEEKQKDTVLESQDTELKTVYQGLKQQFVSEKTQILEFIRQKQPFTYTDDQGNQYTVSPTQENAEQLKEYFIQEYAAKSLTVDRNYPEAAKKIASEKAKREREKSNKGYESFMTESASVPENKQVIEFYKNVMPYEPELTKDILKSYDAYYHARKKREADTEEAAAAHNEDVNKLPQITTGAKTTSAYAGIPRTWKEIQVKASKDRAWYAKNQKTIDEMDAKGLLK